MVCFPDDFVVGEMAHLHNGERNGHISVYVYTAMGDSLTMTVREWPCTS